MKNRCLFTVLSIFAFFLALTAIHAQEAPKGNAPDYTEEVKKTIYAMATAYKQLPQTGRVNELLEFFDPSYATDRIRIGLEDRVEQKTDNYVDLQMLFAKLTNTPGLEMDYRVTEILDAYGTENVGYCMFRASYEAKRNGQAYIIGDETVTYFFKRIDGRYRAVRGHFVQVRDQVNRAECPCRLYKSQADESAYMVQVEIPAGAAFQKKIHTFSIKFVQGIHIIDVDGFFYEWVKDEAIVVMENASGKIHPDAGTTIGKAKTALQAITVILRDYMYRKNCSALKFEN